MGLRPPAPEDQTARGLYQNPTMQQQDKIVYRVITQDDPLLQNPFCILTNELNAKIPVQAKR